MTISQDFDISMPGGVADAVLLRPEGSGPWLGVMHLPDIGGIRPSHRDMAARLAAEGFVVLMPSVFYRTARSPLPPKKTGETPEEFAERFAALTDRLTPEAIASDSQVYVETLAASKWVAAGAPLGVVGYCYTGAFAMRTAAARPDRIAAAASFHGGRLVAGTPDSPHLLLPRIQARLYFGHAVQDRSMPEDLSVSWRRP
jgi:carboxymethylenebutenolidase